MSNRKDHIPIGTRPRMRLFWVASGWAALGLGVAGAVLPVLPTTPFVLLAAFCFGKGSPRLRAWITGHHRFGPIIEQWESTGAIPRRVKLFACTVMTMTFATSWLLGAPAWVLWAQAVGMGIGAAYVLTRPDG